MQKNYLWLYLTAGSARIERRGSPRYEIGQKKSSCQPQRNGYKFGTWTSVSSWSRHAALPDILHTIAVVANGAAQDEFGKWVGEFFSETGTGSPRLKLSSPQTKYYGGEERIAHDAANVMVIGFPGSSSFTSGSSYKPEIAVVAALLGGESSIKWSTGFSLLSKAASEYQHAHVSTQNAAYSDAGLLYVTLTGNASHMAKASKNVVDTIKKIAAGDVSLEDIEKATALAKFRALEAGQNIDAGLEATGSGLITGGRPYQIDELGQSIEKVSPEKVKTVRPKPVALLTLLTYLTGGESFTG